MLTFLIALASGQLQGNKMQRLLATGIMADQMEVDMLMQGEWEVLLQPN